MSKGMETIIAEMLLVGIAVGLMIYFYMFYNSSTENAMRNVEAHGDAENCIKNSNIIIDSLSGNNAVVKNIGGTIINTSFFRGYLNDEPLAIDLVDIDLNPGDKVTLRLGTSPTTGSKLKIIGDCEAGDEIYVK